MIDSSLHTEYALGLQDWGSGCNFKTPQELGEVKAWVALTAVLVTGWKAALAKICDAVYMIRRVLLLL